MPHAPLLEEDVDETGDRGRPVRFAILCDGGPLEAWAGTAIEQLLASQSTLPVAFLVASDAERRRRQAPLLFRFYSASARRRHLGGSVPVAEIGRGVPRVRVGTRKRDGAIELPAADVASVRALDLDFILSLNTEPGGAWPSEVARHGLWAFDFDRNWSNRVRAAEVWCALRGEALMQISLHRLGPTRGHATVLREGWFRVDEARPLRSMALARAEAARWPAAVAATLSRANRRSLTNEPPPPVPVNTPKSSVPSSAQMVLVAALLLRNRLRSFWRHLFRHPQWNIGIVDRPIHEFLTGTTHPPVRWFPLEGRRGFLADPFGVRHGSHITILCESFDYRRAKGTISRIDAAEGVFRAPPELVLELSSHLSYPCVVADGDAVYCVPEILGSRELVLFEGDPTLSRWAAADVLIRDVSAVDPTLVQHDGRWWLMCVDGDAPTDANLLVWHARDVRGPWTPHAANPVKTDVRSARPAGPLFVHDRRLYRPAQDCSETYGRRIVINEVTLLTPEEFEERSVAVIEPTPDSPYPAGRHTVASVGDKTLIDGHRFVFVGVASLHFVRILGGNLVRATWRSFRSR